MPLQINYLQIAVQSTTTGRVPVVLVSYGFLSVRASSTSFLITGVVPINACPFRLKILISLYWIRLPFPSISSVVVQCSLSCLRYEDQPLSRSHGCFFPLPSSNAGRAPAQGVPRAGAGATEEFAAVGGNAMRRATPGRERRPGPVRRRAGGRGHVRAEAADPGGADGGDQLRGSRRVGAVGEALLPRLRLRRVQPRRRAAAAAHGHQARRRRGRRRAGARQRARVRLRRAAPADAGGRGRPSVRVRPSHFLIQSDHLFAFSLEAACHVYSSGGL